MPKSEEKKNGQAGLPDGGPKEKTLPGEAGVFSAGEDEKTHERGRHALRKEKTPAHPAGSETGEGESELGILLRERDELKDKYLRSLAEAENQRKRAEREKSEFFQYALADTLKEFLGVADSLERALNVEDGSEEAGFQEGVRRIHRQLLDVLSKNGVTPIPHAAGGLFDPNVHQALTTEESEDVSEPRVAEELQRGYRLHDRLLRPALVRVVVPKKDDRP